MLNFCTLYHSNYAAKALAMYWSLSRVCPEFNLYVLVLDDELEGLMDKLNLPHVTIIKLSEFEDDELLRVKPTRSVAEYCWTCTASIILYCLCHYNLDHCTYIDSDLCFYSNPHVMIDEMGEADVQITPHWFAPEDDISNRVGKYCVQFVVAKNTPNALKIITDWRNDCLQWCSSEYKDGKMGDQMYLDEWPERYEGVYISTNRGGGVAPWNLLQYTFSPEGNEIIVHGPNNDERHPLVFFHYHACRSYKKGIMREFTYSPSYEWRKEEWKMLFEPYARELIKAYRAIRKIDKRIDGLATAIQPIPTWREYMKQIYLRYRRKDVRYYYWID